MTSNANCKSNYMLHRSYSKSCWILKNLPRLGALQVVVDNNLDKIIQPEHNIEPILSKLIK